LRSIVRLKKPWLKHNFLKLGVKLKFFGLFY